MDQQQEQEQQGLPVKVLVSFNSMFLVNADKHWRSKNFKNRTEYINHLVRKDMEKHATNSN